MPIHGSTHPIPADYSFIDPKGWQAELAWLADLVGWFTHNGGYPSAASRAWDRESSPARDRRSTTVPRNQRATLIVQYFMIPSATKED